MADNIPIQSSFIYQSNWSHEIDSVILGTLIRLKHDNGCEGTVFPSHFFIETKLAIESKIGYSFEWFDIVDRLHFLEKRYKTFNEIVHLEGTYWDAPTNTVIVTSPNWHEALDRNPLLGAYHQRGDPTYNQLYELFALNAVKEEGETTVIVLSDSCQPEDQVCAGPVVQAPPTDTGDVNSNHRFSLARRKLMFDEGGPLDMESTDKMEVCYYVPDAKGKLEMKVEKKGPRILPRDFPPKSPNLAYSCASSSPVTSWRMPRKPNI